MKILLTTLTLAAVLLSTASFAESNDPVLERADIHAAFDLSRPLLLREDASRFNGQDDLPADPTPPDLNASPAEKRLAQLERAASEATTIHALGRLAMHAERLGYDEPSVREASWRLASWAYTSRGRRRAEAGRDGSSMKDFDRALELTPDDPTPLHDRALSLAERGDDRDALEALDRVIEAAPNWVAARRNRATLLLRAGDARGAVADCRHGLRNATASERPGLHELAGRALQSLGRAREGAQSAERGLALAPKDPSLLTLRGDLSAELGLVERAIDDYLAALEGDPENAEVYRRLAWLLATCPDERLRDPRLAIESAARSRQFGDETDPLTLDASAAAHAAAGDFIAAVRFQERAILAAGEDAPRRMGERLALYRDAESYIAASPTLSTSDSAVQPAGFEVRDGGR